MALTARNGGIRPSEIAGIESDIAALDFDLACTLRLQIYDNECRKTQAAMIADEVVKRVFGGGDGSSSSGGKELAEAP